MKKLIIAAALCAPMAVFAATPSGLQSACAINNAGVSTPTPITDKTNFVKSDVQVKCSANVIARYNMNVTIFMVAAGSSKGKTTFAGSSEGGGVAATTVACDSSGCTTTNVDGGIATLSGYGSL